MKLLDLYATIISHWLNAGGFSRREKMHAMDIAPGYNTIYTRNFAKRVFRVSGIKPVNSDVAFIEYVRERMFELHPSVEVIVTIHNYPVRVDVNSEKFQRSLNKASEMYSNYMQAFESQPALARLTGKTYRMPGGGRLRLSKDKLDELYQMYRTYTYLYTHISQGGTTCLTEVFFELCSKDDKALHRAAFDMPSLLSPFNIGVHELTGITRTYLHSFGPATPPPLKLNKKFLPQLLFSDEDSAAFATYKSRGLVGDRGLLLGVDFRSRLPFMVNIFAAPSAQVFLLMGKTGSGKTYTAFQMATSALAMNEYVSAIDIKGREWVRLTSICDAKILTFDARNPSFVNTLRLDDMNANKSNASEFFNSAVYGTVSLLMLIVNLQPGEGNPNDLELVLREAVLKLYSMNGIDPNNPASFERSASLKYQDVLPLLEDLSVTRTYTDDQRKMTVLAKARCHAYLGASGIFAEAFKNEITLGDIMDSNFVIYEFNKNQGVMTDSLDVIRIFMVQFLDSKKKSMLREKGKFLFCFYEELQRCEQFGNLLEYICADVTGSRSNNAVVVLLLNSLKILQGERAQDIRSNITSIIAGLVEDNDITSIREDFNRPWVAHQLELFRDRPSIYRNCFAAYVDTGAEVLQTIYKAYLPSATGKSFQTRTTKDFVVSPGSSEGDAPGQLAPTPSEQNAHLIGRDLVDWNDDSLNLSGGDIL